jgi:hypothetical protein
MSKASRAGRRGRFIASAESRPGFFWSKRFKHVNIEWIAARLFVFPPAAPEIEAVCDGVRRGIEMRMGKSTASKIGFAAVNEGRAEAAAFEAW